MFIVFSKGRCPICGNRGKKIDNNIFSCSDCDISFNDYSVHGTVNEKEKFWN